ncbi:MAG: PEPxxWA-CTERM sorting domain-containing protein [Sphingomonadales bacterium]
MHAWGRLLLAMILSAVPIKATASSFGLTSQYRIESGGPASSTSSLDETLDVFGVYRSPFASAYNPQTGSSAFAKLDTVQFQDSLYVRGEGWAYPQISPPLGAYARISSFYQGGPLLRSYDTITVTSSTLPIGTEVELRLVSKFNFVGANYQQTAPDTGSFASVRAEMRIDNLFNPDPQAGLLLDFGAFSTPGPVFHSFRTRIGDEILVAASMFGEGQAASFQAGGTSHFFFAAGYRYSFLYVPNVRLVSASNGNYATVPEPGAWMLLLAGFGMIGALARRRLHLAA